MNSPVAPAGEWRSARTSMTKSGWDSGLNDPAASLSADWRQAVCVATALICDSWILPETACHAAITAMGEELAPLLCAYGL